MLLGLVCLGFVQKMLAECARFMPGRISNKRGRALSLGDGNFQDKKMFELNNIFNFNCNFVSFDFWDRLLFVENCNFVILELNIFNEKIIYLKRNETNFRINKSQAINITRHLLQLQKGN